MSFSLEHAEGASETEETPLFLIDKRLSEVFPNRLEFKMKFSSARILIDPAASWKFCAHQAHLLQAWTLFQLFKLKPPKRLIPGIIGRVEQDDLEYYT